MHEIVLKNIWKLAMLQIFSVLVIAELGQLTGIAAILRFPMPDNEEDSDED